VTVTSGGPDKGSVTAAFQRSKIQRVTRILEGATLGALMPSALRQPAREYLLREVGLRSCIRQQSDE